MPDREKVIKAIECRSKCTKRFENPCARTGYCHYSRAIIGLDKEIYKPYVCDIEQLCNDALALLKEQEAVKPINSYGTFRCGNCRNIVGYNDGHGCGYQNNFCSKCGRPVKWK